VDRLGLDRGRHEVLPSGPLLSDQRLQVLSFDFVVVGAEDDPQALQGLKLEYVAPKTSRFSGGDLRVFSVPPALRPRYRTLEARLQQLRASVEPDRVELAADGRVDTSWNTGRPQRTGDWIEATWAEPQEVARIELRLDEHPRRQARALRVLIADREVGPWREVPAVAGRPHVEHQGASRDGFSQVLILSPARARLWRLEVVRDAAHRWEVSEIRFDGLETAREP
jgi:hypothetical protein